MADRSNARLNEEIESKIRQWDGTIFGASLKNMYENGTSYRGAGTDGADRVQNGTVQGKTPGVPDVGTD